MGLARAFDNAIGMLVLLLIAYPSVLVVVAYLMEVFPPMLTLGSLCSSLVGAIPRALNGEFECSTIAALISLTLIGLSGGLLCRDMKENFAQAFFLSLLLIIIAVLASSGSLSLRSISELLYVLVDNFSTCVLLTMYIALLGSITFGARRR